MQSIRSEQAAAAEAKKQRVPATLHSGYQDHHTSRGGWPESMHIVVLIDPDVDGATKC